MLDPQCKDLFIDRQSCLQTTSLKSGWRFCLLAGLLNRIRWFERAFPFSNGDVACFHTAPTFVDSLWQIFGPLFAGIPCVVLPRAVGSCPVALAGSLAQHGVTHLVAVPTLLSALVRHLELSPGTGVL